MQMSQNGLYKRRWWPWIHFRVLFLVSSFLFSLCYFFVLQQICPPPLWPPHSFRWRPGREGVARRRGVDAKYRNPDEASPHTMCTPREVCRNTMCVYRERYVIIGSAEALPILCVRCARWEREIQRERERERRKWRHVSSAELGDEFCTFPCQNAETGDEFCTFPCQTCPP